MDDTVDIGCIDLLTRLPVSVFCLMLPDVPALMRKEDVRATCPSNNTTVSRMVNPERQ